MLKHKMMLGCLAGTLGVACASEEVAEPTTETAEAVVNAEGTDNLASQAVGLEGGCSGTLLRNNIVLTAAHCVNTGSPSKIYPIEAGTGKVFTSSGIAVQDKAEPGICSDWPGMCPAARDQGSKIDVAMVRMVSPMTVAGDSVNFVRGLFTRSTDDLFDAIMFCQGRGDTVCNGGNATTINRWSRFLVTGVTENRMSFEGYNRQTVLTNGDSGGGCYTVITNALAPQNQISAVVSTFTCPRETRSEPLEIIRPWVRMMLATWTPNKSYSFSSTSQLADFQIVDASPSTGGPSDWKITGGALRQSKDIKGGAGTPTQAGTHALLKGNAMTNGCVETKVTSNDDDKAGLVFRYFDEKYYYRFYAYEPNNVVISKVVDGVESTVASGQKSFNWADGVKLKICMTNDELRGSLNGTEVVSVSDTAFGDGRVGLYDRLLTDANFDYLTTTNDAGFYPEF